VVEVRLRYTIYHGDCEKALKMMNSNSVHLVVSSPPYFVMRGEMEWNSYEEYISKMERVMAEVYRVLKPGRYVCINMSDYILDGKRYDLNWEWHRILKSVGFRYRDTIIWKKKGELATIGAGKMASNFIKYKLPMYYNPDRVMEVILVFSKGEPMIPRYNSYITEMSIVDISKVKDYLKNVWEIAPRQDKEHPAVFPIELPYYLIQFYSYVGETVLDMFGGTGTTGKAAKMLNRSAILCEIEDKYVNRIKRELGWGEVSLTGEFEYEYVYEVVE
jgi:DNA modification methylase